MSRRMEIPVLECQATWAQPVFNWIYTFWEAVRAADEQLMCKADMVAQGHDKFGPVADPRIPPTQKGTLDIRGIR